MIVLFLILLVPLIKSDAAETVTNYKQLVNIVYEKMVNRETNFQIEYTGSIEKLSNADSFIEELQEDVFSIDNPTTDDFDYLRYNVKRMGINIVTKTTTKGTQVTSTNTLNFSVSYLESKTQLDMVNQNVQEVLAQLDLSGKSRKQKIKQIHDFVVNHVTYDKSYSRYSAYFALVGKSSVCQGYSLLTYKLMTEAGIPCRILEGTADRVAHAWNIVKIGKKWYYIDTTFDDPVSTTPILRYDYYLIGSKQLEKDHVLADRFLTDKFKKQYPISQKNYNK